MTDDEKALVCILCQQCYTRKERCPRRLLCGHTLCTACLAYLIETNIRKCPTCYRSFLASSETQLPTDFTIYKRLPYMVTEYDEDKTSLINPDRPPLDSNFLRKDNFSHIEPFKHQLPLIGKIPCTTERLQRSTSLEGYDEVDFPRQATAANIINKDDIREIPSPVPIMHPLPSPMISVISKSETQETSIGSTSITQLPTVHEALESTTVPNAIPGQQTLKVKESYNLNHRFSTDLPVPLKRSLPKSVHPSTSSTSSPTPDLDNYMNQETPQHLQTSQNVPTETSVTHHDSSNNNLSSLHLHANITTNGTDHPDYVPLTVLREKQPPDNIRTGQSLHPNPPLPSFGSSLLNQQASDKTSTSKELFDQEASSHRDWTPLVTYSRSSPEPTHEETITRRPLKRQAPIPEGSLKHSSSMKSYQPTSTTSRSRELIQSPGSTKRRAPIPEAVTQALPATYSPIAQKTFNKAHPTFTSSPNAITSARTLVMDSSKKKKAPNPATLFESPGLNTSTEKLTESPGTIPERDGESLYLNIQSTFEENKMLSQGETYSTAKHQPIPPTPPSPSKMPIVTEDDHRISRHHQEVPTNYETTLTQLMATQDKPDWNYEKTQASMEKPRNLEMRRETNIPDISTNSTSLSQPINRVHYNVDTSELPMLPESAQQASYKTNLGPVPYRRSTYLDQKDSAQSRENVESLHSRYLAKVNSGELKVGMVPSAVQTEISKQERDTTATNKQNSSEISNVSRDSLKYKIYELHSNSSISSPLPEKTSSLSPQGQDTKERTMQAHETLLENRYRSPLVKYPEDLEAKITHHQVATNQHKASSENVMLINRKEKLLQRECKSGKSKAGLSRSNAISVSSEEGHSVDYSSGIQEFTIENTAKKYVSKHTVLSSDEKVPDFESRSDISSDSEDRPTKRTLKLPLFKSKVSHGDENKIDGSLEKEKSWNKHTYGSESCIPLIKYKIENEKDTLKKKSSEYIHKNESENSKSIRKKEKKNRQKSPHKHVTKHKENVTSGEEEGQTDSSFDTSKSNEELTSSEEDSDNILVNKNCKHSTYKQTKESTNPKSEREATSYSQNISKSFNYKNDIKGFKHHKKDDNAKEKRYEREIYSSVKEEEQPAGLKSKKYRTTNISKRKEEEEDISDINQKLQRARQRLKSTLNNEDRKPAKNRNYSHHEYSFKGKEKQRHQTEKSSKTSRRSSEARKNNDDDSSNSGSDEPRNDLKSKKHQQAESSDEFYDSNNDVSDISTLDERDYRKSRKRSDQPMLKNENKGANVKSSQHASSRSMKTKNKQGKHKHYDEIDSDKESNYSHSKGSSKASRNQQDNNLSDTSDIDVKLQRARQRLKNTFESQSSKERRKFSSADQRARKKDNSHRNSSYLNEDRQEHEQRHSHNVKNDHSGKKSIKESKEGQHKLKKLSKTVGDRSREFYTYDDRIPERFYNSNSLNSKDKRKEKNERYDSYSKNAKLDHKRNKGYFSDSESTNTSTSTLRLTTLSINDSLDGGIYKPRADTGGSENPYPVLYSYKSLDDVKSVSSEDFPTDIYTAFPSDHKKRRARNRSESSNFSSVSQNINDSENENASNFLLRPLTLTNSRFEPSFNYRPSSQLYSANLALANPENEQKETQSVPGKPKAEANFPNEMRMKKVGMGQCKTHGELLDLYCKTCEQWVCNECLDMVHRPPPIGRCQTIPADQAVDDMKIVHAEVFDTKMATLDHFKGELKKMVDNCETSIKEHETSIVQLSSRVLSEEMIIHGIENMRSLVMQKWAQVGQWEDVMESNAVRISQSTSSMEIEHAVEENNSHVLVNILQGSPTGRATEKKLPSISNMW